MKENPFVIKNPMFRCCAPHEYSLEAEVAISDPNSGYKYDRYSTLTFRVDQMGGYPMSVSLRLAEEKDWYAQENIGEICIRLAGDFEAGTLQELFQHVGLMMTPIYGPLKLDEEPL